MKVQGHYYRTIWSLADRASVEVIDQTALPHRFATLRLETVESAVHAIKTMVVRGAPLIGAAAAYGLALALRNDPSDAGLRRAYDSLLRSRPTAGDPWSRGSRRERAPKRRGDGRSRFAMRMSRSAGGSGRRACR
jgi:methylthioribose-1-phosphate isomerase